MSYGAAAYPPIWKNIIGYDKPSTIRPYEKRMNADELALSLRETISRGLVLYMPFVRFISHRPDTITKVFDRSPFGNHGTIHGAVWQTLPSGKSALSFDGVDDYVEVPDSESLHITDEVTVLAWVKPAINQEQYIVTKQPHSGVYRLGLNPEGKIWVRLVREDGTVIVDHLYSNKAVELNKWNFVGFTYDGSKVIKYLNGENVYEITGLSGKLNTDPGNLYVGTYVPTYYNFNGTIDEVRIHSRAQSEEEIRRLFNLTRVFYGV